jgi:cytochrome c556
MEQSAAAGKFEDLKAPVGTVQQTCTACHTARRERMDDGTFRLRIGG